MEVSFAHFSFALKMGLKINFLYLFINFLFAFVRRKALPPDFKGTVFMFLSSLSWLHFRVDVSIPLAIVCVYACAYLCVCVRTRTCAQGK